MVGFIGRELRAVYSVAQILPDAERFQALLRKIEKQRRTDK